MGGGTYNSMSYALYSRSVATRSRSEIFQESKISKLMDPKGLTFREARDSEDHPRSLPIAVFLDVTGSMGHIPEQMVKEDLGTLMEKLIGAGYTDAAVCFGFIGDHTCDRAPLQVGQFESNDKDLIKWLTQGYLEGGGGGGAQESYLLAWLTANKHMVTDHQEKRNQKGFLFTIGDEGTHETLEADQLKELLGYSQAEEIKITDLLAEVKEKWHVYHIHINNTMYRDNPNVLGQWKTLLGNHLIVLENSEKVAETIANTIQESIGSTSAEELSGGVDEE